MRRVRTAVVALDRDPAALDALAACLDPAERARAARYRYARDRDRFIARRGALRQWLSDFVDETPAALRIVADPNGKPELPDHRNLHVSSSHSAGLALFALGEGVAIGCDIERRDPTLASPVVAARFFAADERQALAQLSGEAFVTGFFNCWTRKEAYVKALGLGLSYPLTAFSVSVAPGEPARLLAGEPGWTITAFEPADGFQAALVVTD